MSSKCPSHTVHGYPAVALVLLVSSVRLLIAQTAWLPIPPEDMALKDNPSLPGSSAMILYKEDTLDHRKNVREVYYRIKIFSEEGRKYGDIEIPYLRGKQEVKDLAARTTQPDGQATEFRGAVYDKTVLRAGKFRMQAKVITLPEVRPGTIIEYRYRLEGGGKESVWMVQEPLFVRYARLSLKPLGGVHLVIFPRPAPFGGNFFEASDGTWWATVPNLPPFEKEPWMPPEAGARMRYHVSYLMVRERPELVGRTIETVGPPTFWKELGEALAKLSDDFTKPNDLRGIVQPLIAPSDSAEEKLRKLYAAVQRKIRNLSYEEQYSKKELRQEQMRERKLARDVWNFGHGTSEEITLLFVGLCRAAGLKCDPIYVSGRDTHSFDEGIMDASQLDGQVVVADLPNGPRYLDPATRFAPFGLVSWEKQGVVGFRARAKGSERVTTPNSHAEENVRQRRVTIELQPNGSARFSAEVRLSGQEAIAERDRLWELSEVQRLDRFRRDFEEGFPAANIKQVSWKGLEGESGDVEISYSFDLPAYAISVGPRLLARATLFPFRSPLPNWKRKYSVYFSYPYTRTDEVRIVPPPGFRLEQLPREEKFSTPHGQFELKAFSDGDAVTVQRKLTLQEILYNGTPEFRQVKSFFDAVQASDQKHLVFRQP